MVCGLVWGIGLRRLGCGCGRRLVTGSCVICETTPTGCPRSRPRVSLSIYLSIYLSARLARVAEIALHDMARPRLLILLLLFLARSSAFTLGPIPSPAIAASRCPNIGTARTVQTSMADVTVKFPGGRSATVPVGAPLSLAAYQAGCQVCMLPRIIRMATQSH